MYQHLETYNILGELQKIIGEVSTIMSKFGCLMWLGTEILFLLLVGVGLSPGAQAWGKDIILLAR